MNDDHKQGTLKPTQRQTLTGRVYEQLRDAICSGALPPGQKLVIDGLAREMGVSITPVREALGRLQREGLVADSPYSGVRVSDLSLAELRELYTIRGVLEGLAVRMAAERLTAAALREIRRDLTFLEEATANGDVAAFREHNLRFHDAILAGCRSTPLLEMIAQITRNTERYRRAGNIVLGQPYLDAAETEHQRLMTLLEQRRGEDAEALARNHALTFIAHMERSLETAE
jgi:DNA-binding GntR family transcriptional regulator